MSDRNEFKPVASVLKGGTPIGERLAAIRQIAGLVQQLLDPSLAERFEVANFEGGKLTLMTDSGGWATRARYALPALESELRAAGVRVQKIHIIVRPRSEVQVAQPRTRPTLSTASGELIESTAGGITHKPLAAALRRLASRVNRSQE